MSCVSDEDMQELALLALIFNVQRDSKRELRFSPEEVHAYSRLLSRIVLGAYGRLAVEGPVLAAK